MVDVLREDEQAPTAGYPDAPTNLSPDAAAIDNAAVWQRLDGYMTHRWAERSVEWIVNGPGLFEPRLSPATLVTMEKWDGNDWQEMTAMHGPVGVMLDTGTYRMTYTVGNDDTPPENVMLAYVRLAEYWAECNTEDAGLTQVTDGDYSHTRSANAMARALQYSGAADLLRRYR